MCRIFQISFMDNCFPAPQFIRFTMLLRSFAISLLLLLLCAQSCSTLCDPMDCSHQVSLSMEFSRQEYRSELLFPTPAIFLPIFNIHSSTIGKFQESKFTFWTIIFLNFCQFFPQISKIFKVSITTFKVLI